MNPDPTPVLVAVGSALAAMALHLADELRTRRAWRRTTRTAPLPADDEAGWTALADAVHEAPQAEPGSNDWLYEKHPTATRWED